jgi:hypothetical protein
MRDPGRHRVTFLDSAGAELPEADFDVAVDTTAAGKDGSAKVRLAVTYHGARPLQAAVRFSMDLLEAPDPWWLIPGAFYGANRPEGCDRVFPRFAVAANDPQGMVSDAWEFRADRCATPAVFAWGDASGVALVAGERSALGMTGLGFAHSGDTATVHLTFPYQEGPVTYYGSSRPLPADRTVHAWRPGESAALEFAVHDLGTDRHAYAPVLRSAWNDPAPVKPWVSVEDAAAIAAEGLVRWHYDPDPGVLLETVGFDRGITGQDGKPVDRQAMHVGWVSGIPWAYALLAHALRTENTEAREAACSVISFICGNLSPSGSFWGTWYRSSGWSQSWTPVRRGLHSRTLAEATLFLLRSLHLEAERPQWVHAARANLDLVAARQRDDGNVGSIHHAESGEVLSWEGASGLTWVATFAEAETLDTDGRYLEAAVRAGEYYSRFVDAEFIHGAPEDVDLAPTSEDGYAAVMAYVALYRRTGSARWLDLARRAADWMLTFRYTYNVTFDPASLLGAYGFATRGGDQASSSNQHIGAYGLVCHSELAGLSAALGDPYYLDAAMETLACFRQLVASEDGQVNSYRGMITERYYQTNCFQPKGMLLTLSHAWSVGVLLLACEEELAR